VGYVGELKIWNAETGRELQTFNRYSHPIMSVAFSPDGQRIVTASMDGLIKIWDIGIDRELVTLSGHSGIIVFSVAFSPDGRLLASGSFDKSIILWQTLDWNRR